MTDLPSDLHITAADEVKIRQDLLLVALGKRPADRILRVGRLFDVHSRHWFEDQEIVIKGRRIAWVGPAGAYTGTAAEHVHEPRLSAVPGFGEVHKHIESSHLTPEYEAALVLPRGNSWTCEASHEFSNVDGPHNLELWFKARAAGSPLKIFPQPGSAVPPTAYEWGGGYFGKAEQQDFMAQSLMVTGLDEVMDWPAVWNAENPSHGRLWGMIEATFAARGVVEGHAAGLRALPEINAFAAAGMASDHEMFTAEEAWDKLRRGLFIEIRIHTMTEIIKGLLEKGLEDWSQVAFATDDRSSTLTLDIGATDHNVRTAIAAGLSPEIAIQCVTINPARHMRLTPWVGAIAPGRYADIVLLDDVPSLTIAKVWADGRQVSEGTRYLPEVPQIDWPEWARTTVNIRREITAADFAIKAAPGRTQHAGGGDPAVPLAPGILHRRDAGRKWRGAAAARPRPSPSSPSSTASRVRGRCRKCSGAAAARATRTRRLPARWPMTSTISGSAARPMRRWPRRSMRSARSRAAGRWCMPGSWSPRCASRSAG